MAASSRPELIVAGASARAAAMSALRAGFTPLAFDRFGDEDLRRVADAFVIPPEEYPAGLPAMLDRHAPAGVPLVYTGALEHHPEILRQVSANRPVWGNPGPFHPRQALSPGLAERLARFGWGLPRIAEGAQTEGRWLWKPFRSGGGRGIRWQLPGQPVDDAGFVQEWLDGEPFSVVALADAEQAVLVGMNRQPVGVPWLHAAEFSYCGSVGPIALAPAEVHLFDQALSAIAWVGELRGLFGVDLIRNSRGWWLIEVNPRLTASVELHELAVMEPLLGWHVRCFQQPSPLRDWPRPRVAKTLAKAVYFVPRRGRAGKHFPGVAMGDGGWKPWQVPAWADVPAAGSPMVGGQPLLTLMAAGPAGSEDDLWESLRQRVRYLEEELLQ